MARGTTTVRDIARHANVSSGTVSRVFNQHRNVGPELRDRVLRSAHELGYEIPSATVRQLGRRSVRTISFLLTLPYLPGRSELMAPFWAGVLHGVENEAEAHAARVVYRSIPAQDVQPRRVLARIAELGADAVLLVGVPSADVVEAVEQLGMPVVLIDTWLESGRHESVLPDYAEGSRLVVNELIDAGHRDIAFIGGPLAEGSRVRGAVPAVEMRARGLRDALAHAELPFQPHLVESCDLTQAGGHDAMGRLLDAGHAFTGVFCANDAIASGALLRLREAGIDVPRQVSVVGAGDEFGAHTYPPLTTFTFDLAALGATAVRRLIARADDPDAPLTTTLLAVDLVTRSSVAPAP